jgi:superfamily II DNA or RNA helicase
MVHTESEIMADWKKYEFYIVKHHKKKYNHIVWHTDVIPEQELLNSGFIHNFNKHRLLRIARSRESRGKKIKLFDDYGMDFLAKDVHNKYHAGQVKLYTSKVTAKKLGTFISVVFMTVKNTSFLYTHGDLQINLKENIQNSNGMIVHHKVPFEALGEDTTEKECNDETKLILRPYQEEAIKTLLEPPSEVSEVSEVTSDESDYDESDHGSEINYENRKIVKLFTGGGKTVIAANLFKRTNYKLIICIAPLLTSVENLEERIKPFLKNYESLTVDSDTHGCTDKDEIKKFLTTKKNNKIIFSTYLSTENILVDLLKDVDKSEAFLLVDEVHNMVKVNNAVLCDFSNTFKNALFLSATVPEELYEKVNAELVFDYSIGKAIQDDFCVDYTVYLPLIDEETNSVKIDIPDDLSELPRDLTNKAIFLANGMLLKGNRKCIAYLSNIEESVEFARVLKEVFLKFHGIHMWTGVIHANVSTKDRKSILKAFQNDTEFKFHVLCSVRILDEAIDIPKCDSQFIAHIGENPIRTVQRLGRGLRLDATNCSKHNSMFIWCEDSNNALNALSLLKESDPEFHKKIRVLQTDYDTAGNSEIQQRVDEVSKEVQRMVATKCLSLDEIWEFRCQECCAFAKKEGRLPRYSSKNKKNEQKLGTWLHTQRKSYKKKTLSSERIERLESVPFLIWKRFELKLSPEEKVNELLELMKIRDAPPPTNKTLMFSDGAVVCMGGFWSACKSTLRSDMPPYEKLLENQVLLKDYEKFLENRETNQDKVKLTMEEKINELLELMKNCDAPPPRNKTLLFSEGIDCMGSFWKTCKGGLRCDKSPYDKLLENPVLKKDYEKYLENREKNKDKVKLTTEEKVNELLELMKNRDAHPPRNKTLLFTDGICMGSFWMTWKAGLRCDKPPHDKLLENPVLKKDYEKNLENREKNKEKVKLTLEEKVNELLELMENRDAHPPRNKTLLFSDAVSCVGTFWMTCKSHLRCDKPPYDKLLENTVLKKDYERYLEIRDKNKDNVKLTMEEKDHEKFVGI